MSIKLQFLGATRGVTGSSYLLEVDDNKILVDCGLFQERDLRSRNWDAFPINPGAIDLVLLTHAHLDHCGLLPKLVREGFQGRVICTPPTEEITRIILSDSARIQEEDAQFKRKRHRREGRKGAYPEIPLYTEKDVGAVLPLFQPTGYNTPIQINQHLSFSFHDAGHILGSSMIKVQVRIADKTRTILFSGDVGRWNQPIIRDPTVFDQADYVLVESTYGDRLHQDSGTIKDQLSEIITSTEQRGGNLVIPTFAVERAQELLYYLSELVFENRIPHLVTFVDSPMAINVTEVFNHHQDYFDAEILSRIRQGNLPFYFSRLRLTRSTEESKAINHLKASCIIIAGSGMCTGGRIKHHLVSNISRPESTLLFVGYQARGTLGRAILDGARKVRIYGVSRPVKARIAQIDGFSAHADRSELLRWLSGLNSPPRQVFVVHGEERAALSFAGLVRQEKGWKVSVPHYRDHFTLK